MNADAIPVLVGLLIFISSLISLKLGISVAIIEIILGTIAGNFGLNSEQWMQYLAGFGGIVLTFLAGTEIDTMLLKKRFRESFLIGFSSFLLPFSGVVLYTYYIAGWSVTASLIAGVALSTTSLAVVYSVLVETGLSSSELGKMIMAAIKFSHKVFHDRLLKNKVIEPEIKYIFLLLLIFIYFAKLGDGHAVLPAFVLGLVMSCHFTETSETKAIRNRLRTVAYAIITPIFFVVGGINVSFPLIISALGVFAILFSLKIATKFLGVYFLAKKYIPRGSMYTTLLMSTGLTFGTIASVFGLNSGLINQEQYSVLVGVVVASAVIPTFIAQKWFMPVHSEDIVELNGGENR